MKITSEMIRQFKPCDAIKTYEITFGVGPVEVTAETIKQAYESGLNVLWFVSKAINFVESNNLSNRWHEICEDKKYQDKVKRQYRKLLKPVEDQIKNIEGAYNMKYSEMIAPLMHARNQARSEYNDQVYKTRAERTQKENREEELRLRLILTEVDIRTDWAVEDARSQIKVDRGHDETLTALRKEQKRIYNAKQEALAQVNPAKQTLMDAWYAEVALIINNWLAEQTKEAA